MAQINIQNLNFSYAMSGDRFALRDINLTVEKGEYFTLCGKSGSGKTTLLRMLKPSLTPKGSMSGGILYGGEPISALDRRSEAAEIGFVMQDPDSQIVTDKVWHELAFGPENLGMDRDTIRLRVAEMASYFGIEDWIDREIKELSGGQKQLLNLASVMVMKPSLLILDEPTSQLDPIAAADFLNTLRRINLDLGTTVIITEHRLEDILPVSDRAAVMEEGRIIALDRPAALGRRLAESGSHMFQAMPAAMRVYYALEKTGDSPLTVREGRKYLESRFAERAPKYTEIRESAEGGTASEKTAAAEPAVRVKDLWHRYEKNGKDVLCGTELTVNKGEIFALVGGNGTGKSTLLKSIAGGIRPYRGRVEIKGRPLEKYRPGELFEGGLSMLPQDPASLFVTNSVRAELEEMTGDGELIEQTAKLCGIEHIMNAHPYDISGGEVQRTALAKVLLTEPEILLLDEPTKGMDCFFKAGFGDLLRELKARGRTVIMVSHDVEFCAEYADRVGLLFNGQVVTLGVPERFFSESSFYTTAARRMSGGVFENAITVNDIIELCRRNQE